MQQYALKPRSARTIPYSLSPISAGAGIEIGEDYRDLDLNEFITGGREGFMMYEVTGDSASPDIRPGYLIIVDTWAEPRNGQYVASVINGLTCVKIFQQSTRGLYLVSKNAEYTPRRVTHQDSFRVLGVVRGHMAVHR